MFAVEGHKWVGIVSRELQWLPQCAKPWNLNVRECYELEEMISMETLLYGVLWVRRVVKYGNISIFKGVFMQIT